MTITINARLALEQLLTTTDALLHSLEHGAPGPEVEAKWQEIIPIVQGYRQDVRAGLDQDDPGRVFRGVNRLKTINKAIADVDASSTPSDKAFAVLQDAVVASQLLP